MGTRPGPSRLLGRATEVSRPRSATTGFPDVLGPILGRAAAAVKALTEQAEPFQEALSGDLALEDQLLDRARYIKALAVAAQRPDIEKVGDCRQRLGRS